MTTEPTSKAQSAIDPGEPLDLDEAAAWTSAVVGEMQGSLGPVLQGSSGHLDEATSQNRADRILTLPAGSYSYYFACRGGGEVTFGVSSGADTSSAVESPVLAGPCTGQVQGGDFAAVEGGTEFRIRATGDPIDYVIRYGDSIAR